MQYTLNVKRLDAINSGMETSFWTPAFAGMTKGKNGYATLTAKLLQFLIFHGAGSMVARRSVTVWTPCDI
jgi:hypothetical protein